jgi:ADP-ribosyl-[dinitrogen reductase] hydrolase
VAWLDERARNGGVDEVPLPGVPGRLWLCGKHFIGPDPGDALARTGASVVVCLNEPGELAARYPDYVEWLEEEARPGGRAVWFPIPDLHAPALERVRPLVSDLRARVAAGDGVLVHCGAGIGRAGTIAAALLLALGVDLDTALQQVADARPTAGPQADVQQHLLEALAAERSE